MLSDQSLFFALLFIYLFLPTGVSFTTVVTQNIPGKQLFEELEEKCHLHLNAYCTFAPSLTTSKKAFISSVDIIAVWLNP